VHLLLQPAQDHSITSSAGAQERAPAFPRRVFLRRFCHDQVRSACPQWRSNSGHHGVPKVPKGRLEPAV